jgi:hypothetical protein
MSTRSKFRLRGEEPNGFFTLEQLHPTREAFDESMQHFHGSKLKREQAILQWNHEEWLISERRKREQRHP